MEEEVVTEEVKPKKKRNIAFIVTLIIAILLFLGLGTLGYFYYQKDQEYQKVVSENNGLKAQGVSTKADLEKQLADAKKENDTLKSEKTALEKQIEEKAGKAKIITAYNEFLKYENQVIRTHWGFTGWTEPEYQIARTKAQATGNQNFIAAVDAAWHSTGTDPTARLLAVWDAIVAGIAANL